MSGPTLQIDTSPPKVPNTYLTASELSLFEDLLGLEKEAFTIFVGKMLLDNTTCPYIQFEIERLLPLIGKAKLKEINGIFGRQIMLSVPGLV